ncbi:MAG: transcription antitermination factor NusB [Prevotella sp.]|jgi:N utilization substance protein B|uniref:Transcription antitermination factor NusB n=1 Tax=Segatella cerevisiae TaxID=2053716 RepID=A0ABT1BTL1_9BACT|nr:transcription antitermination factor NusB [Segatella cerevisiae]MCH3995556.1 transcription antitermination factor NusB [Prevotella sp.]MCI1245974.1 transcription antitermination factor NusB [Prevotella sp.]MCO6024426.1 transcription antitermination factor NusB [Segatella cerevisiae]
MINRELIRIKVVQLTYAYYQNGDRNIDNAEKELLFSLSKAYDLYNVLLALIVAVTKEARSQVEVLTARAAREGKEPPSQKFAYNKFAVQLEENKMLSEFTANQKTKWEDDLEFVRKLLTQMQQSELYKNYIADTDDSYNAEREFWRKLYKQNIQENEDLDALLEDKSLYWNDDKEIVDTFVLKTIKRFDPEQGSKQELLPEYNDEEDRDFARRLFRATILNADAYQHYMSVTSRNWDFSRLAYMDVVIMQIAIAEMLTFPNIPVSVTINEYVNLAKLYSTLQSGRYVNGMLDTIARHLNETGKMAKPMEELRPRTNDKKRPVQGTTEHRPRIQKADQPDGEKTETEERPTSPEKEDEPAAVPSPHSEKTEDEAKPEKEE